MYLVSIPERQPCGAQYQVKESFPLFPGEEGETFPDLQGYKMHSPVDSDRMYLGTLDLGSFSDSCKNTQASYLPPFKNTFKTRVNKLNLNPDKTKVLLVGSRSPLGSGCKPKLPGVTLTPFSKLLDPGLL